MNAEIENNIRKNVQWFNLPTHIKQVLNNSSKEYDRYIVTFSIKNQLRYRGNLVRNILREERRYYERVVAYSRERLMLFPYHLADMIVKGLRITPFNYYISVVEKLIQAEKSYDTLPNFTAADCLRLLGIGRNEYIDLMNKSRSNRSRLFGRKNVRCLLPAVPCDIHIESWWRVEVGLVLEEDVKMVNEEELSTIDSLIDFGSRPASDINYNVVVSLYKKGLIYLDVPITAVDRVQVPPLQGFVMNRILGDYFETLLYKIFVSIDEHTTVGELAGVLLVDTELVKQAVSLYCRLQFANKLDAITDHIRSKMHLTWRNLPSPTNRNMDITPLTLHLSRENSTSLQDLQSPQNDLPESPASNTLNKRGQRIAFLYDATLTAYLMMGNLSPGLKKHAVTMFEVGKLCDESLDSFLGELEKVSALDGDGEGEARRFFDHAVILRSTILALKKLKCAGLDLVRIESLHSLDEATCLRLLQKKYKLLVSMAPLSREVKPVTSLSPPHLGPAVPEVNSLWFKMFLYHMSGYGPPSLLLVKGHTLRQLPRIFLGYSRLLVTSWIHDSAVIASSNILQINSALRCAPVLIQAYGVHHPAETYVLPFPTPQICAFKPGSKQDENSKDNVFRNHPALNSLAEMVNLGNNCGYVTFVNTGVLDFGCRNRDPVVRLGKSSHTVKSKVQKVNKKKPDSTCIENENFCFVNESTSPLKTITDSPSNIRKVDSHKDDDKLVTPVESHFTIISPDHKAPTNGFTSQEGSHLLQQELDELEKKDAKNGDSSAFSLQLRDSLSIDCLTSPTEENISMFSRDNEVDANAKPDKKTMSEDDHNKEKGEIWTILDCQFGIPLFDVDANTKICDMVVSGGLTERESLEQLVESDRKLGSVLLDFISQCQYYPGEMEIMKRGRLVPLPKHNLVFDNGKVSVWGGK